MAIARILTLMHFPVRVFTIGNVDKGSEDFVRNLEGLPESLEVKNWKEGNDDPLDLIIDGVFGVGINRPLDGEYLDLIRYMNGLKGIKVAIDLPSGLPADSLMEGEAFMADYTLSFQFPKLSLLVPEHALYTGQLVVRGIGIGQEYFRNFEGNRFFFTGENLNQLHKKFHRFSHKGDFGRVMLAGGSYGKMGAICLSSGAALRTGSGLVFSFVPQCGMNIIQTSLHEVMGIASKEENEITPTLEFEKVDAIGIGPGMGTGENAKQAVYQVLTQYQGPTVLDADALNVISGQKEWFKLLHEKVILTPHLIEFERLAGKCQDHFQRMEKARKFASKYGCTIILKGANTLITFPDGKQVFNSSGTPYMATGGSGDVLTGMLTSFLGQGYGIQEAAICGVFHHGHAGELAGQKQKRSTIASDLIAAIPESFRNFGVV